MEDSFWGIERRKSERALLKTDLFYSVENPPAVKMDLSGKSDTVTLVDLGVGGLGFVAKQELPQNTELEVSFLLETKGQGNIEIKASGKVVYCFPQGDFATYRVGLEFTKIEDTTKALISEYVKNFKAF